jgi:deoxyribodipyrimidine photolyase-related protein
MKRPVIWLFEDQLRTDLKVLEEFPDSPVLLIESKRAFEMWPYHKKRLTFLISAMRHFAQELRSLGRQVLYFGLNDKPYLDSLSAIKKVAKTHGKHFIVVAPSEHHTQAWLDTLPKQLSITIDTVENDLFLTDRTEFATWARSLKSPVMESFYRKTRVKHDVLMDEGQPVGGVWNLDHDNRKGPPKNLKVPALPIYKPDDVTADAMRDINLHFPNHYGSTDGFDLPVTREQAQHYFEDFLKHRLPTFGDYEDAMVQGQRTMFHSKISPLINAGLLSPMPVVRAAEKCYQQSKAPLNAVEGFIRQVLGWREYVYGIYWSFMPEYRDRNQRQSTHDLPAFFWDAKTDLNCLKQSLDAVVEDGYSHHIQRLMVICNFATLMGLNPQQVNDWFLTMYIDSHDWVVTPNVVGMGMNADGGTMATKPYISGAAYINRMSNYCTDCRYDPKLRTGDTACPFNFLFWTFLHHFKDQFKKNVRMSMMLKNAEKIDPAEMKQMMSQRKSFIELTIAGRASRTNIVAR